MTTTLEGELLEDKGAAAKHYVVLGRGLFYPIRRGLSYTAIESSLVRRKNIRGTRKFSAEKKTIVFINSHPHPHQASNLRRTRNRVGN